MKDGGVPCPSVSALELILWYLVKPVWSFGGVAIQFCATGHFVSYCSSHLFDATRNIAYDTGHFVVERYI